MRVEVRVSGYRLLRPPTTQPKEQDFYKQTLTDSNTHVLLRSIHEVGYWVNLGRFKPLQAPFSALNHEGESTSVTGKRFKGV